MKPQSKKLCRAEREADVIGPVERGDRIMARNGARIVVSGRARISKHTYEFCNLGLCGTYPLHLERSVLTPGILT
jgi:hypothetical protein